MSEDNDAKSPSVSKRFPAFCENTGAFAKESLVFLVGRKGPLRAASERRRRWGSVRARLGRVVGGVRGAGGVPAEASQCISVLS